MYAESVEPTGQAYRATGNNLFAEQVEILSDIAQNYLKQEHPMIANLQPLEASAILRR